MHKSLIAMFTMVAINSAAAADNMVGNGAITGNSHFFLANSDKSVICQGRYAYVNIKESGGGFDKAVIHLSTTPPEQVQALSRKDRPVPIEKTYDIETARVTSNSNPHAVLRGRDEHIPAKQLKPLAGEAGIINWLKESNYDFRGCYGSGSVERNQYQYNGFNFKSLQAGSYIVCGGEYAFFNGAASYGEKAIISFSKNTMFQMYMNKKPNRTFDFNKSYSIDSFSGILTVKGLFEDVTSYLGSSFPIDKISPLPGTEKVIKWLDDAGVKNCSIG